MKQSKKIIGMLHLAGDDMIDRAFKELRIYEKHSLYGALIENYHTSTENLIKFLEELPEKRPKINLVLNILPNEYA